MSLAEKKGMGGFGGFGLVFFFTLRNTLTKAKLQRLLILEIERKKSVCQLITNIMLGFRENKVEL